MWISLEIAECCGMENGDIARSRRAITDARYECAAQYERRYVRSIAHRRRGKLDTAGSF